MNRKINNVPQKNDNMECFGSSYYVISMTNRISYLSNIEFHAWIILEYQIIIPIETKAVCKPYSTKIDACRMKQILVAHRFWQWPIGYE